MRKILMLLFCVVVFSGQLSAVTCVITESAETFQNKFVDNQDGTVIYTKNGLVWKRCSEGQVWEEGSCLGDANTYTWEEALQQAEKVNREGGFAGFNHWRLPNIKELALIVERQCVNPAINESMFPNTATSKMYWSSSPYAKASELVRGVSFDFGFDTIGDEDAHFFVRFVTSGGHSD